MTDAEELAVLREFAAKTSGTWTCMGDFFVGVAYKGNWIARRITECKLRGVSYEDGSILAEAESPGPCILAARAKLQAERDAKDAPRLREENERMKELLCELNGLVLNSPEWAKGNWLLLCELQKKAAAVFQKQGAN